MSKDEDNGFEIDLDNLDNINLDAEAEDAKAAVPAEPEFVKNPASVRNVLEDVIAKYQDDFSHLQSNQFAIVQKNGKKAARYAVKKVKLLKGGERLFFTDSDECRDAHFYLEIDKINFNALDDEDQEKALFRQLCKIFYDNENEKYVLLGPDAEIYLAMVRVYGKKLDEVIDMKRALGTANDADEDDD
jgi:hypothetical protein